MVRYSWTRHLIGLLLHSLALGQIQISQNSTQGPCHLSADSLRPITPSFWPYVYRYQWDPQQKTEILWLAPAVRLTIEQRACIRHHITYELRLPLDYPLAAGFTRGLLLKLDTILTLLHRENPAFLRLKALVLPRLLEQLQLRAVGEVAMVPYQEWNFLAQVDTDKNGAFIRLEVIRYLSTQTIQRPGIPEYLDDGWQR